MERYIYHYYEKELSPFLSLSEFNEEEGKRILEELKKKNPFLFLAKRDDNYIVRRKEIERMIKEKFLKKGGLIKKDYPHYFVLGESNFLKGWYKNPQMIKVDLEKIDKRYLSFTYGDSFPTFSSKIKNSEYHEQVYTYEEIIKIIDKYGNPSTFNDDGHIGSERYIEVQVWTDDFKVE